MLIELLKHEVLHTLGFDHTNDKNVWLMDKFYKVPEFMDFFLEKEPKDQVFDDMSRHRFDPTDIFEGTEWLEVHPKQLESWNCFTMFKQIYYIKPHHVESGSFIDVPE